MRIAFLVHAFPAVSETFVLGQVTGLIEAGHEVDIYALRSGKGSKMHADIQHYRLLERTHYREMPRSYVWRGLKAGGLIIDCQGWQQRRILLGALDVRRLGKRTFSLSLLYASAGFLRQKPYDILHCQFGTSAPLALALQDIGAVSGKLVVSLHGSDITSRRWMQNHEEVFERGHLFLPVCQWFQQRLVEQGCDPEKIRVHHDGIKLSRFSHTDGRRIAEGPTRVLTVARLVEKKGVAYAIQAVGRLKASGRPVHYVVAGDGPLRPELERLVDQSGLAAEVQLVGSKSAEEVIALLRDAHLFVLPSVTAADGAQEGVPNVLMEAMAGGVPVISTEHSGIPELVEDDVSGFLVPERDSEALADRLAYLIDHPERWSAMGRAGRVRVEAEFNIERLNGKLVELYRDVLSNSAS